MRVENEDERGSEPCSESKHRMHCRLLTLDVACGIDGHDLLQSAIRVSLAPKGGAQR